MAADFWRFKLSIVKIHSNSITDRSWKKLTYSFKKVDENWLFNKADPTSKSQTQVNYYLWISQVATVENNFLQLFLKDYSVFRSPCFHKLLSGGSLLILKKFVAGNDELPTTGDENGTFRWIRWCGVVQIERVFDCAKLFTKGLKFGVFLKKSHVKHWARPELFLVQVLKYSGRGLSKALSRIVENKYVLTYQKFRCRSSF